MDLILGQTAAAAAQRYQDQDVSGEVILIGQSGLERSRLKTLLDAELAAIGQGLGGRDFRIELKPLLAAMRGGESTLVGSFAAVAVLLALTALASLTLVASGRFLAQRRDQSVLLRIGFRPWHAALFEAAEIVLLLAAAGVLALPLVLALVALSEYAPPTRGLVDAAFLVRMAVLLTGYLGFAGLLLGLGLHTSRARQTGDSGARGAAAIRISLPLLRALQAGQTLVVLAVVGVTLMLVGLMVVLSAGLGALGTMRLIAETRRADLAVRLAMGAWPGRLAREMLRAELFWPALLALGWVPIGLLLGGILGQIGVAWPGPAAVVGSAVAVLAVLALGLYAGLARTLKQSPLETLREADAC